MTSKGVVCVQNTLCSYVGCMRFFGGRKHAEASLPPSEDDSRSISSTWKLVDTHYGQLVVFLGVVSIFGISAWRYFTQITWAVVIPNAIDVAKHALWPATVLKHKHQVMRQVEGLLQPDFQITIAPQAPSKRTGLNAPPSANIDFPKKQSVRVAQKLTNKFRVTPAPHCFSSSLDQTLARNDK